MRDSLREDSSPRESIEIDKNTLYAYNTHNAYNGIQEKKVNHCVRYKPSTHRAVKEYCGTRITMGQFFEEAAVLFIQINPTDRVIVNLENPERRDVSVKDRMLTLICTQELEEHIFTLKSLNGAKVHKKFLGRISKTFDKCYKISNPTDELSNLIEGVLKYVD